MNGARRAMFAVALLGLTAPVSAQDVSLPVVLQRASQYVADFTQHVSGVVAEETYIQDVEAGAGKRAPAVAHRELKSDFLLVQVPSRDPVEFRDIFEVDGRAVRDREDRLVKLFVKQAPSPAQADTILAEGARYNIGRAARTVNTPMRPLLFLTAAVQPEFAFWIATDTQISTTNASDAARFTAPADAWVIGYRELARGGFVRTPQGKGLQVQGRFWLDPASGRVLMSELRIEDTDTVTTIDARYSVDAALGFSVPAEMLELYALSPDGMRVLGRATYGHFRQFTVHTEETVATGK
jgi:hypothetical protein